MSQIQPPPINDPVIDEEDVANLSWILFFNQMYTGDTGTAWVPQFIGLTETGVPTVTGRYYKLSQSLVYFAVRIVPGTNTSSIAGTTYIGNFPLQFNNDGACLAVSGLLGSGAGQVDFQTQRIYVPAWNAVTVPLTIVGIAEVVPPKS